MSKSKRASGGYGKRSSTPYDPGANIPDRVEVPEDKIYVLTEDPAFNDIAQALIEPLAGKKERDWFGTHFYFCLPLTFGNQHGFGIRSLYDITVNWNGGIENSDLEVRCEGSELEKAVQQVSSHFGSGILTIQNRWTFRTPEGINLMVVHPPNTLLEGITSLSAVIESDQLRRDFTFNLKVTVKDHEIHIPKGTLIGCVLPYPRHFIDQFSLALHPEGDVLEDERETMRHFGTARREYDQGLPGLHYMRGEDIYGNRFKTHQKSLPSGPQEEWNRTHTDLRSRSTEELIPKDRAEEIARSIPKRTQQLPEKDLEKVLVKAEAAFRKHYPHISKDDFLDLLSYIRARKQERLDDKQLLELLVEGGWKEPAIEALLTNF